MSRRSFTFIFGVLVTFSLSYGYLFLVASDGYTPQRAFPEWLGAQWITPDEEAVSGYYRKAFLLPSQPNKAYLVAAGTDELTVFVNGNLVGTSRFFGAKVSKIFDITKFLRAGSNLLAISVNNHMQGARPALAARLVTSTQDGTRQTVLSDSSWRVSARDEYQSDRNAAWSSPEFIDLAWSTAVVSGLSKHHFDYPLRVPEYIYQRLPEGGWIGNLDISKNHAVFLREFEVKGDDISDAWLAVGAVGRYSITLNGALLYSGAGKPKMIDLFDVAPYVDFGLNRLLIQVESMSALGAQLLASGYIETDEGGGSFSSDGSWRSLKVSTDSMDAISEMESVNIISKAQGRAEDAAFTLSFKEIDTPEVVKLREISRLLEVSSVVFVVVLITMSALFFIVRRFSNTPLWQEFEILVVPFLGGTVVIGALLIIRYDPRVDINFPFQGPVLVSIAIVIAIWESLILIERMLRR